MPELLHTAAILPAAVGACCTAGRRRAGAETVVAALMALAMADLALGPRVLPAIVWSLLLLVAGLAIAVGERMRRAKSAAGAGPAPVLQHAVPGMVALAAVGAMVMAGQVLAMGGVADAGAHQHAAGLLRWCTSGGGLLYAAVALGRLRALRGRGGRVAVARLELVAMALSVALMSLAVLLGR